MKIETKYFGTIQVDEQTLLFFPNGIFGFEQEKSLSSSLLPRRRISCCACKAWKRRRLPLPH